MAGISVAISGGGHRASLFGLGVLFYLADSGENGRVTSIASVSGGSITNGYLAKTLDFAQTDGPRLRAATRALARTLALDGTFQSGVRIRLGPLALGVLASAVIAFGGLPLGPPHVRFGLFVAMSALTGYLFLGRGLRTAMGGLFGAMTVVTGSLVLALPVLVPGTGWWWAMARVVISLLLLVLWVQLVFGLRGALCRYAYRRTLFPEQGGRAPLSECGRTVDHIFCATELQTADHFYVSPKFVASYLLGVGPPNGVDVVSAVQASTAMPGAFPPQRRPSAPLDLRYPSETLPPVGDRPNPRPKRIHLVDGGVYDNMGEQWAIGFGNRSRRWPDLERIAHRPDELIVVNASRAAPFKKLRTPLVPGLAELQAFGRDIDVMYDQTTAQRRIALVDRFEAAAVSGRGLRGALVHIGQNPFGVPQRFENATGPLADRAARGRAALERLSELGTTREEWDAIARVNASVATTLGPIGVGASARLLWHAYVLATVNLHVILGYPLVALPTEDSFRRLVSDVDTGT